MKTIKLLIFLLFFTTAVGWSQSTGFVVAKDKLVWENVFVSAEQNVVNTISKHGRLIITSNNGRVIKGLGKNNLFSCLAGVGNFKNGFDFDFELELNDGKYRVTVTNIIFKGQKGKKLLVSADKLFLLQNKLKQTPEVQASLNCLDEYLNKVFRVNKIKNKS